MYAGGAAVPRAPGPARGVHLLPARLVAAAAAAAGARFQPHAPAFPLPSSVMQEAQARDWCPGRAFVQAGLGMSTAGLLYRWYLVSHLLWVCWPAFAGGGKNTLSSAARLKSLKACWPGGDGTAGAGHGRARQAGAHGRRRQPVGAGHGARLPQAQVHAQGRGALRWVLRSALSGRVLAVRAAARQRGTSCWAARCTPCPRPWKPDTLYIILSAA